MVKNKPSSASLQKTTAAEETVTKEGVTADTSSYMAYYRRGLAGLPPTVPHSEASNVSQETIPTSLPSNKHQGTDLKEELSKTISPNRHQELPIRSLGAQPSDDTLDRPSEEIVERRTYTPETHREETRGSSSTFEERMRRIPQSSASTLFQRSMENEQAEIRAEAKQLRLPNERYTPDIQHHSGKRCPIIAQFDAHGQSHLGCGSNSVCRYMDDTADDSSMIRPSIKDIYHLYPEASDLLSASSSLKSRKDEEVLPTGSRSRSYMDKIIPSRATTASYAEVAGLSGPTAFNRMMTQEKTTAGSSKQPVHDKTSSTWSLENWAKENEDQQEQNIAESEPAQSTLFGEYMKLKEIDEIMDARRASRMSQVENQDEDEDKDENMGTPSFDNPINKTHQTKSMMDHFYDSMTKSRLENMGTGKSSFGNPTNKAHLAEDTSSDDLKSYYGAFIDRFYPTMTMENSRFLSMDTSAPTQRPRSSSIDDERRLEDAWNKSYANPSIEASKPAFSKSQNAKGNGISHPQPSSSTGNESLHDIALRNIIDKQKLEQFIQKYGEPLSSGNSLITNGLRTKKAKITKEDTTGLNEPEEYAEPFINFMTENPTVWHAIQYWEKKLERTGFVKLSPRESWNDKLKPNGKYYVNRNGTSLIAFSVGGAYKSGNGIAMVAAHSDSLTARLKPVSTKNNKAGYVQLGVAPYAGALNETWWDRDLGIGGRVLVQDEKTGYISQKLVKLGWPIARIPTLAPHFGVGMFGQNNKETQLVPIIGLDNSDVESSTSSPSSSETFQTSSILGAKSSFISTQPPKLVNLITKELGIENKESIINWELELFDTQPAQLGGLDKEFIFSGRIDDKVCSWSSIEALLSNSTSEESKNSGIISMVGLFDDEEIGSLLRQGAKGNFLPGTVERIVECFNHSTYSPNLLIETYAKSFLVSFDVTHATNPNFLEKYLENHAPRLNIGLTIEADSNGHTTTDSVSTAIFQRLAEKSGQKLQVFMIRNDSRSGGTVGPMLSSAMGVRAIDVGIPQLSMHSIRATTGSKDPGLGVKMIEGVFKGWEGVDAEFDGGNGW